MKKFLLKTITAAALLSSANAFAAWTDAMKITEIQVVEFGGFLLTFDRTVNAACTASGNTSRIYIYPGQAGATSDGVKAMLSASLAALSSGLNVKVLYTETSPNCWGQYLLISK